MFDRFDLARRLREKFDKFTVEKIFLSLSDDELHIASTDSCLTLEDFPLLATMKELSTEERDRLVSKAIPSEYLSDFIRLKDYWIGRHEFLSGGNLSRNNCPRQADIQGAIRELNRCNVFYNLRLEYNMHHPVPVAA